MPNSSTKIHTTRVQWRDVAARLAAAAQSAREARGDASCKDAALARRFAMRKPHTVSRWFTPGSGLAITLGDILALPRQLARDILTRALAALDSETLDPREALDLVQLAAGDAQRALRSGMDPAEPLGRIAQAGLRALAARQQQEAA